MHFACTALCMRILCSLGFFPYVAAPVRAAVIKAVLDCGSVGLMNMSLSKNSVGVYQLSKLACIPCTVVFQLLFFRQGISAATAAALVPLCIGVGFATISDVDASLQGHSLIFLLLAMFSHWEGISPALHWSGVCNYLLILVVGKGSVPLWIGVGTSRSLLALLGLF
jgi:solute carrier family 35 protein E3